MVQWLAFILRIQGTPGYNLGPDVSSSISVVRMRKYRTDGLNFRFCGGKVRMPRFVQRLVPLQFFKIIPKKILCYKPGYRIPAQTATKYFAFILTL